uniref:Uncharacterized protein n=1 Tax=Strongyloides stercoralis TaxID=6248 RepID=A0A0K0ENS0_STRER
MKKIFHIILFLNLLVYVNGNTFLMKQLGYPYKGENHYPYPSILSLPLEVKYPSSFSSMYYGLGSNIRQERLKKKYGHKQLNDIKMMYSLN